MEFWLRFAAQWISLAAIGFAVSFFVAPGGLTWLGVLIVLVAGVLLAVPK